MKQQETTSSHRVSKNTVTIKGAQMAAVGALTTGGLLTPITAATSAVVISSIGASYIPKFFVPKAIELHQEKLVTYIKKEKLDIPDNIMNFIRTRLTPDAFELYNTELHTVYNSDRFAWLKKLPKVIGDFLFFLSGKKNKDKAVKEYNELLHEIQNQYASYETEHNNLLMKIQSHIDNINKAKPILKDYILLKLSVKLREMGIDSKVSDYPMEHLDYRIFPLKEEYNLIATHKLAIEETAKDLLDSILYCPYLWVVLNYAKTNELRKKKKRLSFEEELTLAKMKADLMKMESFSVALDNIANIFKETKDVFVPLLEKIIHDIESQYHSQYDNIPDEVLAIMQSSSKIIKGLTEKKVIKDSFSQVDIDEVQQYSNSLSIKYNELKNEILKMAS